MRLFETGREPDSDILNRKAWGLRLDGLVRRGTVKTEVTDQVQDIGNTFLPQTPYSDFQGGWIGSSVRGSASGDGGRRSILIARRITDKRALKLVRAFLNAGVMENGLVSPAEEETPQGGSLSPLLSNIVLDELDRELEKRDTASCATRTIATSTSVASARDSG